MQFGPSSDSLCFSISKLLSLQLICPFDRLRVTQSNRNSIRNHVFAVFDFNGQSISKYTMPEWRNPELKLKLVRFCSRSVPDLVFSTALALLLAFLARHIRVFKWLFSLQAGLESTKWKNFRLVFVSQFQIVQNSTVQKLGPIKGSEQLGTCMKPQFCWSVLKMSGSQSSLWLFTAFGFSVQWQNLCLTKEHRAVRAGGRAGRADSRGWVHSQPRSQWFLSEWKTVS